MLGPLGEQPEPLSFIMVTSCAAAFDPAALISLGKHQPRPSQQNTPKQNLNRHHTPLASRTSTAAFSFPRRDTPLHGILRPHTDQLCTLLGCINILDPSTICKSAAGRTPHDQHRPSQSPCLIICCLVSAVVWWAAVLSHVESSAWPRADARCVENWPWEKQGKVS